MNVTASTRSLSENNITAFSDNETETTTTPAIEEWWLLWQYVHGWKIELYAFPVVLVLGWICNGMAIAVLQTQAYRGTSTGFLMTGLAFADLGNLIIIIYYELSCIN